MKFAQWHNFLRILYVIKIRCSLLIAYETADGIYFILYLIIKLLYSHHHCEIRHLLENSGWGNFLIILDIHRVFKYKVNQKQKFWHLRIICAFWLLKFSIYLLHLSSNKHKCFIYYLLRTHLSIRSINMSNSSGSSGSEQEVDATPFHLKKN